MAKLGSRDWSNSSGCDDDGAVGTVRVQVRDQVRDQVRVRVRVRVRGRVRVRFGVGVRVTVGVSVRVGLGLVPMTVVERSRLSIVYRKVAVT